MAFVDQQKVAVGIDVVVQQKVLAIQTHGEHPQRHHLCIELIVVAVTFPHGNQSGGAQDDRAAPFCAFKMLDDRGPDEALAESDHVRHKNAAVLTNHRRRLADGILLKVRQLPENIVVP